MPKISFLGRRFIAGTIGLFLAVCQAAVISTMWVFNVSFAADPVSFIPRKQMEKDIRNIITSSELSEAQMGIKIISLKTGEVIFVSDENRRLKPASNIKLVTTLAALKYLGPNYQFKTKIYTDGVIRKGELRGNLFIKGFGDPFLVSEQLWFLTNELKRKGFRQVSGNLILDDSYFDDKRTVRNGSGRQGERAYDALLGALSVNFNTSTVYVEPGKKIGSKPMITIDPDNDYIKVRNQAKTIASKSKMTLRVTRVSRKIDDLIVVSGGIPLGYSEKRHYRNISYPRHYAAQMFRRFFKEQGLTVKGRNRFEMVPANVQELLVYESKPLRNMVSDLNRISNNFIAEQILKTMAAELKGAPGTTDNGIEILKEFLREVGITNHYEIVNGSGLSADNLMTAAHIVEVLKYGYQHFNVFPEYVGSMGVVGVDGTVDKRLLHTVAQGRIRAKTGSLENVSALSGYLNTLKNETLAFSLIMNDRKNRGQQLQRLQDQILLLLCQLE